jgi:DNA-binding transcriptional MerR regulator
MFEFGIILTVLVEIAATWRAGPTKQRRGRAVMADISTLGHSNLSSSRSRKTHAEFRESAPLTAASSGGELGGRDMTIGEMARAFGVSLRTLRFYEDRGLIRPRREGAARYYGGADRRRLDMILNGKRLGFTLGEIFDLVGAQLSDSSTDFEEKLRPQQIINQIGYLERQRGEIEIAIERLRATHKKLGQIEGV